MTNNARCCVDLFQQSKMDLFTDLMHKEITLNRFDNYREVFFFSK